MFHGQMPDITPAQVLAVIGNVIAVAVAFGVHLSKGQEDAILAVAGLFLVGVLVWTLLEYIIHRYVFHYEPKSRLGKQFHFIVHGVHHDYPNDARRLVMPPSISLPLASRPQA